MPRISVVVPIYNVEAYLEQCLDSLKDQTMGDLEVVMVDDGSTDGSGAIAQRYADADERFRLVTQANGGLAAARNTGIDHARGEFLAFLDSDDYVPLNAYEILLASLDETGSDFATGNVHRVSRFDTAQALFVARTFARSKLRTHVLKFRPLILDRIAPNKLWRRSFWDAQGFRFPEGMLHEDIPVVVAAQFAAKSVDVIQQTVYYWRIREDGDLSITQRRLEQRALGDRVTAVEMVVDHLERHASRKARRWYIESTIAEDLRYYLDVLDSADDDYRQLFLDRVNAFLDRAPRIVRERVRLGLYRRFRAIDRLKWHLVRRRLMPELLEVLRFHKEDYLEVPPVRIGSKWYGDYPFRTDERLKIPRRVFRLDRELDMTARVEDLRWDGKRIRLSGHAYIRGVGAPAPDTQDITITALRGGRFRRLRLKTSGVSWKARTVERPDVTASAPQRQTDLRWAGFEAEMDPRRLRRLGRWRTGNWELFVTVRAGDVKRRRKNITGRHPRPLHAVDLPELGGAARRVAPGAKRSLAINIRRDTVVARDVRVEGDVVELTGDIHGVGSEASFELARRGDRRTLSFPFEGGEGAFKIRIALAEVHAAPPPPGGVEDARVPWDLIVVEGDKRRPVVLPEAVEPRTKQIDGMDYILRRSLEGNALLVQQEPRPVVTEVRWTGDAELELAGDLAGAPPPAALLAIARDETDRFAFPVECDAATARFKARIKPARVPSLAGMLPLAEGAWELHADTRPLALDRSLHGALPMRTHARHKEFTLGSWLDDRPVLYTSVDLDEEERGPYNQRGLQKSRYDARRGESLRDTVVYSSFDGRQYSDSPRAIHRELVRRDAPLEHLWVVKDAMFEVPEGAIAVREGSREHYEAMAQSRYVVTNDFFPDWFSRRENQVCLQTWHGTPLKRLHHEVAEARSTLRQVRRQWDHQIGNWQYVLSPNAFTSGVLQRAFAIEGEMLETGYPRTDILASPSRDAIAAGVRRRLGLPDNARIVLYAPTYRDHVVDKRSRFRLDPKFDVGALSSAAGDDTIILFRGHPYITGAPQLEPGGRVRDVSAWQDGTELLLVADALVTDYSSVMFDFANTGKPMLFYTYDREVFQERIRGFYLDLETTVPGPLLASAAELGDALQDLDGVRARYADRYAEFASTFCPFDDGRASERVVDAVFERVATRSASGP